MQVKVKTVEPVEGRTFLEGALVLADADAIVVASDGEELRVPYADVASARTVFEWGTGLKPGKGALKQRSGSALPASPREGGSNKKTNRSTP